ncbi:MAG TPA: hypothetical protein VF144_11560 [Chitinophagaceae bacterium]
MNTELLEAINVERQRYVDFFIEEIALLRQGKDTFATELPIQTNDETQSYPFNIIRVDFITKDENNEHSISELRLDKNLNYKTLEFNFDNLKLFVNPFCWNSCEFQVDKIDIDALRDWLNKWLKMDNENADKKLSIAVHSCTKPEINGDKLSFVIDLGTATENALTEFIEILNDSGTTEVIIQTTEI